MGEPKGISPSDVAMIFNVLEERVRGARGPARKLGRRAFAEELHGLRDAYRNAEVVANYGDERVRGAYLLAYYPHHIHAAFRILKSINHDIGTVLSQRPYRALFLAGGPLPELVALALLGASAPERAHGIAAECLDLHPWGAGVTHEIVNTISPSIVKEIYCKRIDLRSVTLALVGEYDLIMMQNCLNEMNSASRLAENVERACASLRPGGHCVFSDLAFYGNPSRLGRLRDALGRSGLVFEEEQLKQSYQSCFADPPRWLLQDLYEPSDEIPKRNMRTATLIMRKPFQ